MWGYPFFEEFQKAIAAAAQATRPDPKKCPCGGDIRTQGSEFSFQWDECANCGKRKETT